MRTSLCVASAVAVYGLSFGALAVTAGFSPLQTVAMSLLMFNGASQFAFVGVLGGGGPLLVAVLSAWLIGARNSAYGLRLGQLLEVRGPRRLLAAGFTIDESTALAVSQLRAQDGGRASRFGFWSAGIATYALWNVSSCVGAWAANAIGDPRALGLDTAAAAGLAGLVWPALREGGVRLVVIAAAGLTLVLTPVLPVGLPVMFAGILAVATVPLVQRALQRARGHRLVLEPTPQRAYGTAA